MSQVVEQSKTQVPRFRVNTNVKNIIPNHVGMIGLQSIPTKNYYKGTLTTNPFRKYRRAVYGRFAIMTVGILYFLLRPDWQFINEKVLGNAPK